MVMHRLDGSGLLSGAGARMLKVTTSANSAPTAKSKTNLDSYSIIRMLITRLDASVVDRVLALDAHCRRLNLAQNAIADVEAGCLRRLPELRSLDVSENALRGAAWVTDAPALEELVIAGNAV